MPLPVPVASVKTCNGSVCNCKALCKAYYSGHDNGKRARLALTSKALGPDETSSQIAKRILAIMGPSRELVPMQAERSL